MLSIWTLTYNDDNGVWTEVFNDGKLAENAARQWCLQYWDLEAPMPDNWREAYEVFCDRAGFIDSIVLEKHNVFPPDNGDDPYVKAADRIYTDEGRIEVDHNAIVSPSEDGGAYVQGWLWVYNDEAGICRECGDPDADNGEGWDGLCGNCADKL